MLRLRTWTAWLALMCVGVPGACSSFTSADDPGDGGAPGPDASSPEAQPDGAVVADAAVDAASSTYELASGFSNLWGIAADEQTVYFTEQSKGRMHMVALSGDAGVITPSAAPGAPLGLALSHGSVFWCDKNDNSIRSWSSGNPVSSTGPLAPAPFAIAAAGTSLVTLAFDFPKDTNTGYLQIRGAADAGIVTNKILNLANPFDIAVDGANVYWTESATGAVNQIILPDVSPMTLAPAEDDCEFIAADSFGVYWTRATAAEIRVHSAGTVKTLAPGETTPVALASDASGVYWIRSDGTVRRWSRADATVGTVADGFVPVAQLNARSLAVTTKYVVWLTDDGRVLRHAK